jgi:hypothetical protein
LPSELSCKMNVWHFSSSDLAGKVTNKLLVLI